MVSTTISYSGINTKVKAMSHKLISKEDLHKISSFESVIDLIAFLKKHPGYQKLFEKYDEHQIHRGEAERIFINGLYEDYTKIYRFANDSQKKDLELIFFRYEVNVLKACIRLIQNKDKIYNLSSFQPFFMKHSKIDFNKLSTSNNMEEYINHLKGTDYYKLLFNLSNKGNLSSFDYEMVLDVYYFTKSWKLKDQYLNGNNRKAFTHRIGTEIDLLNIMWIYRSKKMFDMGSADILTYLIPINYRLSMAQLSKLISATSLEEFMNLLSTTKYKDFALSLRNGTMEQDYARIINKIYLYNITRYPASMAVVNYYLFRRDKEVSLLTTAIECIRYGLDLKKKQEYLQII